MYRIILIILFSGLSINILKAQTLVKSDTANIWIIAQKSLHAPMGASSELQEILTNSPAPNLDQAKRFSINGKEQWIQFIARSKGNTERIEQLIKQFLVTVKEDKLDGVTVRYITPPQVAAELTNDLFIHLHGGAYVLGGGIGGIEEAIILASRAKIKVISIDYAMPPESPFPAAIDDVVKVYRILSRQYSPEMLAIGGSSAGGGLALACIHKFKELNLDLPGAVFAGTPWADLTKTGDSQYINEGVDHILVTYDGLLKSAAQLYAGEEKLTNALISPVYGNFEDFPPTYLVTGTRDLFLSDVVRTHRKLKQAGVVADLNVYEGMSHGEYSFLPNSPESVQVYTEFGDFLIQHLK